MSAASTPTTRYIEPPAKSPITGTGVTGRCAVPSACSVPDTAAYVMSCPARCAHGPVCPHPVIRACTSLRVAGEALLGPEAEPLDHARPVALDEHVGVVDEPLHDPPARLVLEVDRDARPGAAQATGERQRVRLTGAVDPHDVGAQLGEHHPGEGGRPDATQLDHPDAGQRARAPLTAAAAALTAAPPARRAAVVAHPGSTPPCRRPGGWPARRARGRRWHPARRRPRWRPGCPRAGRPAGRSSVSPTKSLRESACRTG